MNEYGLDVSYFKGKLSLILRDIGNYTPEEMYRELCRAAEVAKPTQKEPNRIKLLPMPTEENPRQWYFDCDDLYIDVEDLNGEVSIFVKNRSNNATGWKELIEKPPAPQGEQPMSFDQDQNEYHTLSGADFAQICDEIKALQKENASLKLKNEFIENVAQDFERDNLFLKSENQTLKNCVENSEQSYKAIAQTNEAQAKRIAHLEYKIDELMLEWCPDEMTPEQLENYAKHQRKVSL